MEDLYGVLQPSHGALTGHRLGAELFSQSPGIRSRSSDFWIDADIEVQMTTGEYRLDGGLVDE